MTASSLYVLPIHNAPLSTAQTADPSVRKSILQLLSKKLVEKEAQILEANKKDIEAATTTSLNQNLLSRLALNSKKLETLAKGIQQIADQPDPIGRVLRRTEVSPGLTLEQQTVPLGVLLVIFESRPDALPQIAALSISSGNGLILKGGKEALHSNAALHTLVQESITEATAGAISPALVSLVESRADVASLLSLDDCIDLIIPRGSSELVKSIQQSTRIPVMGHSEGICHVYLDAAASIDKALRIVIDSKTDYPAACNAAETVLIHKDLLKSTSSPSFVEQILIALQAAKVTIHAGPKFASDSLSSALASKYSAGTAADLHHEYGDLSITVELVEDLGAAIDHIHKYGSSHTESIVTEDAATAKAFLQAVDSACVFHNASTRFADGFRFGLGAEVGISTSRLHARGPVGVDGLTSTKWRLVSSVDPSTSSSEPCHTVGAFAKGLFTYTHKSLPL